MMTGEIVLSAPVPATAPGRGFIVWVSSWKSAEKHGAKRAYLARLALNGDMLERAFAPQRRNKSKSRVDFALPAQPGDVFEARRWRWNGDRQSYEGGMVTFAVTARPDGPLEASPISREEAVAILSAQRLAGAPQPDAVALVAARRMAPEDICFMESAL